MTKVPAFSVLTAAECAELLARNHFGRLAFRTAKSVDIQPIGYVAGEDWLYMRSAHGAKLEAVAHNPYVAFEVDEIEGPFDWRNVVAHGTIYLFSADGSTTDQSQFRTAVEALRTVMPNALTATDSVPERQTVYGLHVDRMEGRMAQSRLKGKSAARSGSAP
jgi:nitroimidazol reductase NimA-like FMN-containing flavoprotein (pyridoxamine 5'-phosphate oxidase superfamily)